MLINDLSLEKVTGITLNDLKDTQINWNLIANTIYNTEGHKSVVFAVPEAAQIITKAIAEAQCGRTITCGTAKDFKVDLEQRISVDEAIEECPANALSTEFMQKKMINTIKQWVRKEQELTFAVLEASAVDYVATAEEINYEDVVEGMLAQFESYGYDRADLVIAANGKVRSALNKLKYNCCNLWDSSVTAKTNRFDAGSFVAVGNRITSDVVVYVKEFLLPAASCIAQPQVFDGPAGSEWYGYAVMQGHEYFGAKFYNPEPLVAPTALKYTAV